MKAQKTRGRKRQEAGVALLISILILLLISVVAISLVVASRTESALTGNYRSSTTVYYAGMAGLEEARGRMLTRNPNYFNNTVPNFVPQAGGLLPLGQVRYILNPLPGEVVAPTNLGSTTTYADNEFLTEFGVPVTSWTTQTIGSVSTVAGIQGPLYKWVRITAATERSLGVDVDNDGAPNDNAIPLYYDPNHVNGAGALQPSLIVSAVPPSTALQALEITALAVLPNGSKKLLQYVVTPVTYGLNFPSALTLTGSSVNFAGANSNQYYVNGADGSGGPAVPGCTPNAPSVPAVGVTNPADVNTVINGTPGQNPPYNGIPGNRISPVNHYTGGAPLPAPSVSNIGSSLNPNLQSPTSLNNLVQTITANADLVVTGNATQANMPAGMSVNNPMTVVVDGNFSMTGPFTGYGLLVVTGNFAYSGTTGWNGIVLVIGDGTTSFLGSGGGNNGFAGAIYAATIKDAQGNLLPSLGVVNFDISGGGGSGVYYNSCWVKNAQQPPTYRVLSFREITY